jgi:hypothetical protein
MAESGYIIGIDDVNDIKEFFKSLLSFFAPIDVTLTTWGKLPQDVHRNLSVFKAHTSWMRRLFLNQIDWHLNKESVNPIIESLCIDSVLETFTWGIIKGNTPLGLCRTWDDMNINGSDLIEDATLFQWVEKLKSNGTIESYEKIID